MRNTRACSPCLSSGHIWHVASLARLAEHDPLFQATRTMLVDFEQPETKAAAIAWWLEMTAAGGEGMVVKPEHFISKGEGGRLLQPAVQCRGQNYLRIIDGPDYDTPENLIRLRKRGLNAKRSLASREFALGLEALERPGLLLRLKSTTSINRRL